MPSHPSELGPYLEATNLDPNATHQEIRVLANDAIRYQVAAVCVYPYWVPLVVDVVAPYNISVSTVVSYPHGLDSLDSKLAQLNAAEEEGAKEATVILNPVRLNVRDWQRVAQEAQTLHLNSGLMVKVGVNASRLSVSGVQSAARYLSDVEVSYLALYSDSEHPTIDDLRAALQILIGTQTDLLAMGNYTNNLAALRAVNAGARRISTQFPARLVGP